MKKGQCVRWALETSTVLILKVVCDTLTTCSNVTTCIATLENNPRDFVAAQNKLLPRCVALSSFLSRSAPTDYATCSNAKRARGYFSSCVTLRCSRARGAVASSSELLRLFGPGLIYRISVLSCGCAQCFNRQNVGG